MNRPEFITKDSRIIISENNLKIVGQVTEPLFDTDKNPKMFTGAAQGEKKKRRMSNQPSDLSGIQSGQDSLKPSVSAQISGGLAIFEELKTQNTPLTPMRHPEPMVSDGDENNSDYAKSEGKKSEKQTLKHKPKNRVKTAFSLENIEVAEEKSSSDQEDDA